MSIWALTQGYHTRWRRLEEGLVNKILLFIRSLSSDISHKLGVSLKNRWTFYLELLIFQSSLSFCWECVCKIAGPVAVCERASLHGTYLHMKCV